MFPHIDGFPLLCAALTPFLLLGVFMTTRPALPGYGVGYCIFFCFLAGPDNVIHYDPSGFMNDAMALVLSMLVSSIVFAVLLPPSTPWLRNRLLIDLRRQVVMSRRARLRRVRSRFESGARDLMFQINALAEGEPEFKRDTLRWLFSVLEVGNAVIDLRREIAALPADARYARRCRGGSPYVRCATRWPRCSTGRARTASTGARRDHRRDRRRPTDAGHVHAAA